jgi:eukaryotic translation initiation factor 2C
MIKISAKAPPARMAQSKRPPPLHLNRSDRCLVGDWRRKLNYENLPKLKHWGVEIQQNMMQVPARVLQAPNITYGGGKNMRTAFG